MATTMNIVSGGFWQRKKLGTAVFDDQHQFTITPLGGTATTYGLSDLQSVQWEPNGWSDKMLRNPVLAFVGAFVVILLIHFLGFVLTGKPPRLGFMLGFCTIFTLGVSLGKAHRARFQFADGQSALLAISKKFASTLQTLKPGVGPA